MRILIISDIHGNRFGLEAVLAAAADRYDFVVSLGDVVGYGAHPNECCWMLREHEARCLSGNHDAAALGLLDLKWFNPVAEKALLWTRRQLTEESRQWLQSLPPQLDFPEWDFQTVHASLRRPWEEYITGPPYALFTFELMERRLCFFGHTHMAACYCYRDAADGQEQVHGNSIDDDAVLDLSSDPTWRYLINPGSCGQPRDGNPQARYAIFDTDSRQVNIHGVDYDWKAARRAIMQAGLPRLLGDRLGQGR